MPWTGRDDHGVALADDSIRAEVPLRRQVVAEEGLGVLTERPGHEERSAPHDRAVRVTIANLLVHLKGFETTRGAAARLRASWRASGWAAADPRPRPARG